MLNFLMKLKIEAIDENDCYHTEFNDIDWAMSASTPVLEQVVECHDVNLMVEIKMKACNCCNCIQI